MPSVVTSPAQRPSINAVAKGVQAGQGVREVEAASKHLAQLERAWEAWRRSPTLGPTVMRAGRETTAASIDGSRKADQLPMVGAQLVRPGNGTGSSRMAAARMRCSKKCGITRRVRRVGGPKEALAAMSKWVSSLEAFSQTYSQLTKAATPMTRGLSWAGLNEVSPV